MHKTLYQFAILKWSAFALGSLMLFIFRWKAVGEKPKADKCVMIAAPHTSNWDFFFTLMISFRLGVDIYWMGKQSLFTGWRGPVMRFLGGVPIDRSKKNNLVEQMVDIFNQSEKLILIVPPEGTRKQVTYWKTGFYHIANNANVPIILGFLDFASRRGGVGPTFHPTGDIESDMQQIKAFYKPINGKITENYNKNHVPNSVSPAPIDSVAVSEIDASPNDIQTLSETKKAG